jgi:hypothetical protein
MYKYTVEYPTVTVRCRNILDVRFVLDQHEQLDIYNASLLKQQSADRHVATLGHIILISSQSDFVLGV